MRKDLRIGLGIGLVLLLVLAVYLLIPKNDAKTQANQQTGTENADGGADPEPAVRDDAGPGTGEPAPGGTDAQPREQPAAPGGNSARPDVFAGDAGRPAPSDAGNGSNAPQGGTDWASLLNDPPLMTATPVRDNLNPGTGGTGATSAAIPDTSGRQTGATAGRGDEPAGGPAAPAVGARQYRVQSGDHFPAIARQIYGDAKYYQAIQRANPNVDPTRLQPGMTINLPDPAEVKRSAGGNAGGSDGATERAVGSDEYRVQQNDSLYKIAMERYNSPKMADAIYELNREAIGPNPARLKLNMVLKMPPAPANSDGTDAARQAAGRSGQ